MTASEPAFAAPAPASVVQLGKGLNARQWAFALRVGSDPDVSRTRDAIDAGYSPRTARKQAHRLWKNANVQAVIVVLRRKAVEAAEVTLEQCIRHLGEVAIFDIREVVQWGPGYVTVTPSEELAPGRAAMVKRIKFRTEVTGDGKDAIEVTIPEIEFHDKLAALVKLIEILRATDEQGGGINVYVVGRPSDYTEEQGGEL